MNLQTLVKPAERDNEPLEISEIIIAPFSPSLPLL